MDLWWRRLPRHANVVLNRYLFDSGDIDGPWRSCRCSCPAGQPCAPRRARPPRNCSLTRHGAASSRLSRGCTSLWPRDLQPPHPRVVAVGGLSGSGKSTLALGLAPSVGPVPGAVVLRSDEIRKGLCAVPALHRLGPEGYSARVSERVYSTVAQEAEAILRAGHSVIVDAVYAGPADRAAIEHVAEAASVPFIGFWLDAPESVLIDRTAERRNDASDADASVVRRQGAQTQVPSVGIVLMQPCPLLL